jgi:hypothetical protein
MAEGERVLRVRLPAAKSNCYYIVLLLRLSPSARADGRRYKQRTWRYLPAGPAWVPRFCAFLSGTSLYQRPATALHTNKFPGSGLVVLSGTATAQSGPRHRSLSEVIAHHATLLICTSIPIALIAHRCRAVAEAGRRRCSPTHSPPAIPLCQNKYLFWLCPQSAITSSCKAARVVITGVACLLFCSGRHKPQWRQSVHVQPC